MPIDFTRPVFLCALAAAGALALAGAKPSGLILYNATPSMPVGFYMKRTWPVERGAIVTVLARDVAAAYAASRGFADRSDRFLKRVAATTGDVVCADGGVVTINHNVQIARRERPAAPPFPSWDGCRRLMSDEVLLLGDSSDSFDGRYWGPTRRTLIEGVWSKMGQAPSASPPQK